VQRLRRLAGRRSARQAERCFVVEGVKVVREALASGVGVESVYVDRASLAPDGLTAAVLEEAYAAGSRVFDLAPGVLARVADTVTPQPIMAVVEQMDVPLRALGPEGADGEPALIVVCVDVRDPGNAGTILRSAEAAGATGVVCCDGSVDVFNPKTVRSSAGALFRVPVVTGGDAADVLAELGRWGLRRLAAVARGGVTYTDADLTGPVALVLGNEAHGLPGAIEDALDGRLTIPMAGRAESLNAGMAGAVLCFEAARQRSARAPGASPTVQQPTAQEPTAQQSTAQQSTAQQPTAQQPTVAATR
jgi:TrmH family RNA methyltransferase